VLCLAVLTTVGAARIALGPLQTFANSADEDTYVWMAERIAEGRLGVPAGPLPEAIINYWRVPRGDVLVTTYPPTWPAIMAPFAAAGVPWLAAPVLAGLIIVLLYRFVRDEWGDRGAALAAATLVATSTFFLFNAASYFTHIVVVLLTLIALERGWSIARGLAAGADVSWRSAFQCGVAAGLAGSTRPPDVVIVLAPALIAIAPTLGVKARAAARLVLPAVLGFALGFAPLPLHNRWATGSFWTSAYELGGLPPVYTFDAATWLDRLARLGLYRSWLLDWAWDPAVLLLAVPLVLWAPIGARRRSRDLALVAMIALAALTLVMNSESDKPGNQYGPRYVLIVLVPTAILIARALRAWIGRTSIMVLAVLVIAVAGASQLVRFVPYYSWQINERRALYRAVAAAGLDDAVIFLGNGTYEMARGDLTRNDPELRAPVVYALDRGPTANVEALARLFGTRAAYRWWYAGPPGRATLAPLDPVTAVPRSAVPIVDAVPIASLSAVRSSSPPWVVPAGGLQHAPIGADGGRLGRGLLMVRAEASVEIVVALDPTDAGCAGGSDPVIELGIDARALAVVAAGGCRYVSEGVALAPGLREFRLSITPVRGHAAAPPLQSVSFVAVGTTGRTEF